MRKVITYGTFDLLHFGHINILKCAKELGDYLIVGLSTDEFNKLKNKKAYFEYEKRKIMLEAIKYVDEVIPEEDWEQKKKDIQNITLIFLSWAMIGKGSLTTWIIIAKLSIYREQKVYRQQVLKGICK